MEKIFQILDLFLKLLAVMSSILSGYILISKVEKIRKRKMRLQKKRKSQI